METEGGRKFVRTTDARLATTWQTHVLLTRLTCMVSRATNGFLRPAAAAAAEAGHICLSSLQLGSWNMVPVESVKRSEFEPSRGVKIES